jgi:hypothetical protein
MKPILLLLFLALALHATAQTFSGRVTDMSTHKPLAHVIISSWQHNRVAETDSNGNFSFRAGDDKQFYFVLNGYAVTQKPYTPVFAEVAMTPLSVTLNDVTIRPYDAFQSDSAEMADWLYGNELGKEAIKAEGLPRRGIGGGRSDQLSGSEHFSKKAKQAKRFKEDFRKDMEQKFVDVRYTPSLVCVTDRVER